MKKEIAISALSAIAVAGAVHAQEVEGRPPVQPQQVFVQKVNVSVPLHREGDTMMQAQGAQVQVGQQPAGGTPPAPPRVEIKLDNTGTQVRTGTSTAPASAPLPPREEHRSPTSTMMMGEGRSEEHRSATSTERGETKRPEIKLDDNGLHLGGKLVVPREFMQGSSTVRVEDDILHVNGAEVHMDDEHAVQSISKEDRPKHPLIVQNGDKTIAVDNVNVPMGPNMIRIRRAGNLVTLGGDDVHASVQENSTLEVSNGETVLKTADNVPHVIKIAPKDAASIAQVDGAASDVRLETQNDKALYRITGQAQGRFLGVFNVVIPREVQVDANNGSVVGEQKPWWNIFVF